MLLDEDGKIYAVYGARTIRIVELNADLTALVPGTDHVLIERERGLGEGSHMHKLRSIYYIVSATPGAHVAMKCARADSLNGPWEIQKISENERQCIGQSYRLEDMQRREPPFELTQNRVSARPNRTLIVIGPPWRRHFSNGAEPGHIGPSIAIEVCNDTSKALAATASVLVTSARAQILATS